MESTTHVQDALVAVKGYYGSVKEMHRFVERGLNLVETVAWWAIERADAVLFATNTREPFFKAVGFAEGKANQALATVYSTQAAVVDRITKAQTAVWNRVEAVRADVQTRVEDVRTKIVAVRTYVTDRVEAVRADVQTRVEDVRTKIVAVRTYVTDRVEAVRADVQTRVEDVRTKIVAVRTYVTDRVEAVRADVQTLVEDVRTNPSGFVMACVICLAVTIFPEKVFQMTQAIFLPQPQAVAALQGLLGAGVLQPTGHITFEGCDFKE